MTPGKLEVIEPDIPVACVCAGSADIAALREAVAAAHGGAMDTGVVSAAEAASMQAEMEAYKVGIHAADRAVHGGVVKGTAEMPVQSVATSMQPATALVHLVRMGN